MIGCYKSFINSNQVNIYLQNQESNYLQKTVWSTKGSGSSLIFDDADPIHYLIPTNSNQLMDIKC